LNTKIRLIARRAFGFHHPEALIGLAMLSLGGLCPALPGRRPPKAKNKTIRCLKTLVPLGPGRP
jgi:hypothetical protein